MTPSETPSEFLAACDAYTEMVTHALSKSNFSDAPNNSFSPEAVAEILKHSFILRELAIPVRKRVLAKQFNNSTSTVELQAIIVEEGGWGLKGAVRKVSTHSCRSDCSGAANQPSIPTNLTQHDSGSNNACTNQSIVAATSGRQTTREGGHDNSGAKSDPVSSVICYGCGEIGHIKSDCPDLEVIRRYKQAFGMGAVGGGNHSGAQPAQPRQDSQPKWCPYHRSASHSAAECNKVQKLRESTREARSYSSDPLCQKGMTSRTFTLS